MNIAEEAIQLLPYLYETRVVKLIRWSVWLVFETLSTITEWLGGGLAHAVLAFVGLFFLLVYLSLLLECIQQSLRPEPLPQEPRAPPPREPQTPRTRSETRRRLAQQ